MQISNLDLKGHIISLFFVNNSIKNFKIDKYHFFFSIEPALTINTSVI